MSDTVEIDAPSGVIALWDGGAFSPPGDAASRDFIGELRDLATDGKLFFIDAEDHVTYRIDLRVESAPPSDLAEAFEARSGAFGLHAPTGQIHLASIPGPSAGPRATATPGDYLVQPYARRELDVPKYDRDMERLVGPAEWRYRRRVDKLGAVGCLAWVALAIVLAIPATRALWYYAVPLLALPSVLYLLLSRMRRYAEVERKVKTHESSMPHFVIVMRRSAAAAEIPGGWTAGL